MLMGEGRMQEEWWLQNHDEAVSGLTFKSEQREQTKFRDKGTKQNKTNNERLNARSPFTFLNLRDTDFRPVSEERNNLNNQMIIQGSNLLKVICSICMSTSLSSLTTFKCNEL